MFWTTASLSCLMVSLSFSRSAQLSQRRFVLPLTLTDTSSSTSSPQDLHWGTRLTPRKRSAATHGETSVPLAWSKPRAHSTRHADRGSRPRLAVIPRAAGLLMVPADGPPSRHSPGAGRAVGNGATSCAGHPWPWAPCLGRERSLSGATLRAQTGSVGRRPHLAGDSRAALARAAPVRRLGARRARLARGQASLRARADARVSVRCVRFRLPGRRCKPAGDESATYNRMQHRGGNATKICVTALDSDAREDYARVVASRCCTSQAAVLCTTSLRTDGQLRRATFRASKAPCARRRSPAHHTRSYPRPPGW